MGSIFHGDIEGMSNEEAELYFGVLTENAIACGDLVNQLDWSSLARKNPVTSNWEGPLVDFMSSPPAGAEALAEGLKELFSHLNKIRSVTIDTNEQPWAGKLDGLCSGLVAVGVIDESFKDKVVELGGGYAHAGTDYQAIRDQHEADLSESAEAERIRGEADEAYPVFSNIIQAVNTSLNDVLQSRSSSAQEYIDAARAALADIESIANEEQV